MAAVKRCSKPTLSAIDTSFTSPAMSHSPSVFSSATISTVASSVLPNHTTDLKHPSPKRYEAQNSPLLKDGGMTLPSYVSPPTRPTSPISPLVVRAKQTFFYEDISPSDSSPLSETSDYYCLRQGTPFRQQWANVSDAPTPPPQSMIPNLPMPSTAQRAAIRLWESRVTRGTPAPPSPPTPAPPMTFSHQTSHLELSPVEYDIQELSTQIQEIHSNLARSESLFKQGMLSVYLQQNAAAARLASSPTDAHFPAELMQRPSSVDSVSTTASFHRREAVARQRAVEARTRAMVAAQEREEQRKDFLKMTLVDRIEREVNEIERRAIRDLQMVREARYALHMELERERARERRRALEAELAIERERQEAEDARREDEEEAARLLAVISQATEAIEVVEPVPEITTTATEEAEDDEEEEEEELVFSQECFFQLSPEMAGSTPSLSLSASPSLSHSMSTRPSTPLSTHSNEDKNEYYTAIASARNTPPTLALKTCVPTAFPPALPTAGSLKSPLFSFLASPISPCSPSLPVAFTFSSARNSLNMEVGLGFELTFAETAELNNMDFNSSNTRDGVPKGCIAACA